MSTRAQASGGSRRERARRDATSPRRAQTAGRRGLGRVSPGGQRVVGREPPKRVRLELASALLGEPELTCDFAQRRLRFGGRPEAKLDHPPLVLRQGGERSPNRTLLLSLENLVLDTGNAVGAQLPKAGVSLSDWR